MSLNKKLNQPSAPFTDQELEALDEIASRHSFVSLKASGSSNIMSLGHNDDDFLAEEEEQFDSPFARERQQGTQRKDNTIREDDAKDMKQDEKKKAVRRGMASTGHPQ